MVELDPGNAVARRLESSEEKRLLQNRHNLDQL